MRMKGESVLNIIYDDNKNTLRTTKFSESSQYNLEDILFYVPLNCETNNYAYINGTEIVKLELREIATNYRIFSVPLDRSINLENGISTIRLICLDDTEVSISKNDLTINISVDNYNLGNQLSVIEDLSKDITRKYQKIMELTQMNINIYQDMQEVAKK